jgi:outer membrane protein OmpA-like peptidoglycan-associated protein
MLSRGLKQRLPGAWVQYAIMAPLIVSQFIVAPLVEAQERPLSQHRVSPWYFGAGVGLSRLSPDASEINNVSVADETSSARQLSLGWQVLRRLALELQVADFGQSNLDNGGRISYRETSANALWFLRPRTADARTNLFARFGFGRMDNSAEGVPFVRDNNFQRLIGVGMEYRFSSRLVGRLEYTSYDRDVKSTSIGLVYSTKQHRNKRRTLAVDAQPAAVPMIDSEIVHAAEPAVAAAVALDVDSASPSSNCPGDIPILAQTVDDCLRYRGHIPPVYFSTGSAALTDDSLNTLGQVVELMTKYSLTKVSLQAHTDSVGALDENTELAQARATAGREYLVRRGVASSRLHASAYGESRPRATDDTASGRQQNRRVEIYTIGAL